MTWYVNQIWKDEYLKKNYYRYLNIDFISPQFVFTKWSEGIMCNLTNLLFHLCIFVSLGHSNVDFFWRPRRREWISGWYEDNTLLSCVTTTTPQSASFRLLPEQHTLGDGVDASSPPSPRWSCSQRSPCCPRCCWWVCTGPPRQSADGGGRQRTMSRDTVCEFMTVALHHAECKLARTF